MLCRWEAHIWVKELGRQVYLGGYEHEEHAAEAYDVAALKCKGFRVKTNFDADRYAQHISLAALRCIIVPTYIHRSINIITIIIARFLVGQQDVPGYAQTRSTVFRQY